MRSQRRVLTFLPLAERAVPTASPGPDDKGHESPVHNLWLGERVWFDRNANGRQEPNEPGIGGVTVELWHDGHVVGQTKTEPNGDYLFTPANVPNGTPT